MTVKELKAWLNQAPEELEVVLRTHDLLHDGVEIYCLISVTEITSVEGKECLVLE